MSRRAAPFSYSSSLLRGLKKIPLHQQGSLSGLSDPLPVHVQQLPHRIALENEAMLDKMDARMARNPDILRRRRELVEHPSGSIKQWMNQGAFLIR